MAEVEHAAAALDDGHEGVGREQDAVLAPEAREGLEADDVVGAERDTGW